MVSRSEKEGNQSLFTGSDFLFRFTFLSVSVDPIHYSFSLITLFPYKPGIGDCISIDLDTCKVSILGNRSAERKDVDF